MNLNITDRHGNGLIERAVKFYPVGETETPTYEAETDNLGGINLDDYDGDGHAIAEGLYDVKIVAGNEDGSDQWEQNYLISKSILVETDPVFVEWLSTSSPTFAGLTVNNFAFTVNGAPTLNDWFDQSVKTTADVVHNSVNANNYTGADRYAFMMSA
jgi:hypothetical protein